MTAWIELLEAGNAMLERPPTPGVGLLRVARFGALSTELAAARESAIVCPLLDWAAVSVTGPDAATFLQGQFTNDVMELAPGAVQLSSYCSPKGRVLANFALGCVAPNEFLLVVPADIVAGFVRRLRMFVLRAKVAVVQLEATQLLGLRKAGPALPAAGTLDRRDGASLIELPDGRVIAICDPAQVAVIWNEWTRAATPVGSPVWDALAVGAGMPFVTTATQDKFVPQMLNWELLGGISFRKGCYTGQEIVARMQYLGRLKERLFRAHTAATGVMAGQPVFGTRFGEQACGTIVNPAPSANGGSDVLAVLQIESAGHDAIRVGAAPDSPALTLHPLPYDVPAPPPAPRRTEGS